VPAPLWLWRGWIDATRPDYRPGVGDVVTVEAVDAKGEAGRTEVGRLTAAVGAGETATARVARIADYAVVPAHRRLFDDTGITLLGTQLGGRATNLFDAAADSSGGAVFGDANGFLVYRHRDWLSWPAAATADVSIGNRPGDTACPSEWEIAFARADFATRVVYGRSGEDPYTIDDAINQARYGVETYTVNNLETATLATLHELGQRLARARSFDRAPRVAAVTLNAADPGARDVMAAVSPFLPTLASVGLVEDDGRTVFTRMAYVTAVEHTITAQAWTARIALDDAWPYMQQSDARYDVALYDVDRYARAV
jgi:hypothetical protein